MSGRRVKVEQERDGDAERGWGWGGGGQRREEMRAEGEVVEVAVEEVEEEAGMVRRESWPSRRERDA